MNARSAIDIGGPLNQLLYIPTHRSVINGTSMDVKTFAMLVEIRLMRSVSSVSGGVREQIQEDMQ